MRVAFVLFMALAGVAGPGAQEGKDKPAKRFEIEANLENYPQDTPKNALASVLKVMQARKIDYLLAHLADPKFVNLRVRLHDGNFAELVKETTAYFSDNPTILKDLKRYLNDGEWGVGEATASVYLKENKDKRVYLRKVGNRWFLENEQKKREE